MGNGEGAMVIPAENKEWGYSADATNSQKGLYLSVLLRVKENNAKNTLVYPYITGGQLSGTVSTDAMCVIYMAIEKETGKILKHVYRGPDGNYFTDPDFSKSYVMQGTEEIRHYGWAAVPFPKLQDAKAKYRWKSGYQYTYALDYSVGVGVHDPGDPYPGTPIISKVMAGVTETVDGIKRTWPTVNNYEEETSTDVTITME